MVNLQSLSRDEVQRHCKDGDLWIIIDTYVYDLSKFAKMHPGGIGVLLDGNIAGKDCTTVFYSLHRHEVLVKYGRFKIGQIAGESPKIKQPKGSDLSRVPYGEPNWLRSSWHSPYYNDGHRRFQVAMREFVSTYILPDADICETTGKRPPQCVFDAQAKHYIHHMRLGPGPHLDGLTLMGGVKGEDFDIFHELIMAQEYTRVRARGYTDALTIGICMGVPPIKNFAKEPVRTRALADLVEGGKLAALAITEAFAGSDVAGLQTTATKSANGSHWVINGTKKWITGGMMADYFIVGCRTGKDLTVFLVERSEGLDTKQIKVAYSQAAGTAYVTFDNVKVPSENMLGEENKGLYVLLSNFNHERWYIAALSVATSRAITEECLLWATQRKVFGKPLMAQPVVRQNIAKMIANVEAMQSWVETITFQMKNMTYDQQSTELAGPLGMLKATCTRVQRDIIADAVNVFGGRGITQSGMGKFIEYAWRTHKTEAVPGGAEEVLFDLGVRQAMKHMPDDQRL